MDVKTLEKIKNKKDKKVIDSTKESMIQLVHQMRKATRKSIITSGIHNHNKKWIHCRLAKVKQSH